MKFLLVGLLLTIATTSFAQVPLRQGVGHTLIVVKDISVPGGFAGVHFQDGQLISADAKKDVDYDAGPLCFIKRFTDSDYQNHPTPTVIKAGTTFVLGQGGDNTVRINVLGNVSGGVNGYTFSTSSPEIISVSAEPIPNWMDAPARINTDPKLLDFKILSQCFGDYIAVAQ